MHAPIPPTHRQVLTPELLIAAYAQGLFPMARSRRDPFVDWHRPAVRAILPLEQFRCPRSLRQKVQAKVFDVRFDTAFDRVVRCCAAPRRDQKETWINNAIIDAYTQLHHRGLAHSVEAWREGRLVGGLYGIRLRGAFFGESMFHRADHGGTDASKVCLVHLVDRMKDRGFALLDVQVNSPHMEQFGTIDIPHRQYMLLLGAALQLDVQW